MVGRDAIAWLGLLGGRQDGLQLDKTGHLRRFWAGCEEELVGRRNREGAAGLLRMHLSWANSISTFFRSRRELTDANISGCARPTPDER